MDTTSTLLRTFTNITITTSNLHLHHLHTITVALHITAHPNHSIIPNHFTEVDTEGAVMTKVMKVMVIVMVVMHPIITRTETKNMITTVITVHQVPVIMVHQVPVIIMASSTTILIRTPTIEVQT